MEVPQISIIVPVYNAEKYLRQCLDSIIAQNYIDWECILVDDGSKDGSGNICDEYTQRDNRFKVFHQDNAGSSFARNVGIENAKGYWVSFIDADDWIAADHIKNLIACAETNDAEIVISAFYEHKNGVNSYCPNKPSNLDNNTIIVETLRGYGLHAGLWNKLIKKELIDSNGIRFPYYNYYEDMFFTVSVVRKAKRIAYVQNPTYYYRIHSSSLTNSTDYSKRIEMYNEFSLNMQELFDKFNLWDNPQFVEALYNTVNINKYRLLNLPKSYNCQVKDCLKSFPDSYKLIKLVRKLNYLYYIAIKYRLIWPIRMWLRKSNNN